MKQIRSHPTPEKIKVTFKDIEQAKRAGKIFLTPAHLASRWFVSLATLSQWRWTGDGPPYLKMGKRILYDLEKIEHFEDQKVRTNTSQHASPFLQKGEK